MLRYAGNSGKVIEKSQMLQAKDKTLFEKIRDYLTDLVNRIKKAYKDVRPETPEGEIISGMLDKAEEIQQLFTDAIADASENFKGAEVGHHPKHKGRIYYTITFAAPVEINGVRGNMAVVVRVDEKNYYKVHRLILPDGNQFVFDKKETLLKGRAELMIAQACRQQTISLKVVYPIFSKKSSKNSSK